MQDSKISCPTWEISLRDYSADPEKLNKVAEFLKDNKFFDIKNPDNANFVACKLTQTDLSQSGLTHDVIAFLTEYLREHTHLFIDVIAPYNCTRYVVEALNKHNKILLAECLIFINTHLDDPEFVLQGYNRLAKRHQNAHDLITAAVYLTSKQATFQWVDSVFHIYIKGSPPEEAACHFRNIGYMLTTHLHIQELNIRDRASLNGKLYSVFIC